MFFRTLNHKICNNKCSAHEEVKEFVEANGHVFYKGTGITCSK